jgi:leader peptidase (prepilin peptidase)/N-methyltransferase
MIHGVPQLLVSAWVVLLGAVVGSFLNVVIARLPAGQSVVRPRSRCPRCQAPIAWYDNLPVVSYVALRARCRSCRAPISPRYPLVEILGAAAAYLAVRRHGLSLSAAVELLFVADLVALAFIDLDTWELPHVLTWPVIVGGLLAATLGVGAAPGVVAAAWGAAVGFAAFALVSVVGRWVAGRPALGFGDVFLLSGLGSFLGVQALLPVVLLASVQGAAVGLALMALGRMPRDPALAEAPGRAPVAGGPATPAEPPPSQAHAVPFGPFLVLAALEWLLAAGPITSLLPMLEIFR